MTLAPGYIPMELKAKLENRLCNSILERKNKVFLKVNMTTILHEITFYSVLQQAMFLYIPGTVRCCVSDEGVLRIVFATEVTNGTNRAAFAIFALPAHAMECLRLTF